MNWIGVLLLWLVLMAAEVVHGILRGIVLVPRIGRHRSSQVGVFSGSVIIVVIAWLLIHWIGAGSVGQWLAVGGVWVALTVIFEILLGRWAFGYAWLRIAAEFDLRQGGLMPVGLLMMGLTPVTVAWMRGIPPFGPASLP